MQRDCAEPRIEFSMLVPWCNGQCISRSCMCCSTTYGSNLTPDLVVQDDKNLKGVQDIIDDGLTCLPSAEPLRPRQLSACRSFLCPNPGDDKHHCQA